MPLPDAIRQQIVSDNLRTATVAWNAWLTSGSREDITDRMAQINIPVYIAAGDKDQAIPLAVQQTAVLPWLPTGTTLQIIPGAGHLTPYEAPDAVLSSIALPRLRQNSTKHLICWIATLPD